MKIELTQGEANGVLAGECRALIENLLRVEPLIKDGKIKEAYAELEYEETQRFIDNLEEIAGSLEESADV